MTKEEELLGSWGETIAAEYLRSKQYQLIGKDFWTRYGDIDLIAIQRKHLIPRYIVFVEVKLRKNADFALAREAVTRQKMDRIRTAAKIYLSRYPSELQPRFDVIEIYAPEGYRTEHPKINHLEDAFT